MLEKHKLYDPSENTKEEILDAVAIYGAMRRSVWLQEGGTKYFNFLETPRYAVDEATAERDLYGFKLKRDIPERMITSNATGRHQASKKRVSTDSALDTRTPKARTAGPGQGQRGHAHEAHSDSPTPNRVDRGSPANHANKALPPTPTPSELDRSWQSMRGSQASQREKSALFPMSAPTGLLHTPRPSLSLRQSQTFRGEVDGSEDIDGPDLDVNDDFLPLFASNSPQGPVSVAPRTGGNQGDQPTTQPTEDVDECTYIPLISSSDDDKDDNNTEPETARVEFSFDEGNTIAQVPQLPVLAPVVSTRSTSDETAGQENKEDTSMTDAPVDGDESVKIGDWME
ncbi:hypothetical protein BKA58DRAFT_403318 [Alternaria rosae]|uniref:uncharacterized protein n=1 Tax=Alternaria rosae TaxID=1187941 RepID=UPI001E8D7403|nr:uncharacterized protein BKA58DRAFT_403318 [Alternaria rosae]KAH6866430.1 hypothetical protein BKA58DRAFT_403318 [Alternaria rosae]